MLKTLGLTAIILFLMNSIPANALSVFMSESAFIKAAPITSTETFDEIPNGTRIAENGEYPCDVEAVLNGVVYTALFNPDSTCWWVVSGNISDGPPPVSSPNLLISSGIASGDFDDYESLSFGSGYYAKALGFYFHSAISAEWLEKYNPNYLGWEIAVAEVDGKVTIVNVDSYLGAGPAPLYLGFLSESGIEKITVRNRPGSDSGVNWGYDNVSRSEIVADLKVLTIDIKPGQDENTINARANGGIWVAVLSDIASDHPFDPASQIDTSTVKFGPAGAKSIRHRVKDINQDGVGDLLLRFKILESGISCGDTSASLVARGFDGQVASGVGFIRTVSCPQIRRP